MDETLWETVKQIENTTKSCFRLQKKTSQSEGGYLFKMKHTVRSILQPQSENSWRIISHIRNRSDPSHNTLIVLASQNMEYISQCWEMIQTHYQQLLSQLELLDTIQEQKDFIDTKISSLLLTNSSNNTEKYRHQSNFKELFHDMIPTDHDAILTWYSCSFSTQDKGHQGWMYILPKFICLYSYYFGNETKWIIELKNVILVKKTKAFHGLLDNAITIKTLDGTEYHIYNLFHRNEVYDLIHQLCHDALHEKMTSIMSPSTSSFGSNSITIHHTKKTRLFQEFFHLPKEEHLRIQQAIPCKCSKDEVTWLQGYSYLSDHYLCFVATPTSYEIRMVLPLYLVIKLERFSSNNEENSFSWLKSTLSIPYEPEIHIYLVLGSNDQNSYQDQFHLILKENSLFTKTLMSRYKESSIIDWKSPHGLGEYYGYPTIDNVYDEQYSFDTLLITSIGELRSLLITRQGFPNTKRGWIWSFLCGSWFEYMHDNAITSDTRETFDSMIKFTLDDIEKDLHRSLPEYIAFQKDDSNGLELLRRVLTRYALKNPDLGYCQAMNLLASVLLIYMDEEMTIYTLERLCNSYFPGYFSTSMSGAVTDQQVFLSLVQENLPTLYEHFKRHHIDITMMTTPWFLSAYITQLSISLVPCMMDWLFLEGNKILFQLGLATLKINGDALMQVTEAGDVMDLFKGFFDVFKINPIEFHKWIAFSRREYGLDQKKLRELRELHQLSVIHYIDDLYKQTHIRSVLDRVGFERHQLEYLFQQYQTILYYKSGKSNEALLEEFFGIVFPSWAIFNKDDDSMFVLEKLRELVEKQIRTDNEILNQSITFQQIILAVHHLLLLEGTVEERISSFCSSIISYDIDKDYWISLSRVILFIGRNMEHSLYNELQASVSMLIPSALSNSGSVSEWIVEYMINDKMFRYFFDVYLPASFLSRTDKDMHIDTNETDSNILDQVDEFLSQMQTDHNQDS